MLIEVLAASAASFQPVNPAMRIGRSSSGNHSKLINLFFMEQAYHARPDLQCRYFTTLNTSLGLRVAAWLRSPWYALTYHRPV